MSVPEPPQQTPGQTFGEGQPSAAVQPAYAQPGYGQPGHGQPGYGQPPYAQQAVYYQQTVYAPGPPSNGMAIASLISSLVGILVWGIGAVVGVILGHIAMKQLRTSGEAGKGMATAGLIIGYIQIGFWVLALLVWLVIIVGFFGIVGTAAVVSGT
ncbi:MAG: DUF4190 domain-containing protein [Micrococcales bacterium]|nr:DUF4190 domain-containing protein [Micrococcales bacterium]